MSVTIYPMMQHKQPRRPDFWTECILNFFFFLIVVPCILIYEEFSHQQIHFFILKNTLTFTVKYT